MARQLIYMSAADFRKEHACFGGLSEFVAVFGEKPVPLEPASLDKLSAHALSVIGFAWVNEVFRIRGLLTKDQQEELETRYFIEQYETTDDVRAAIVRKYLKEAFALIYANARAAATATQLEA